MVKRYTLHGLLTIGVGCVNQEVRVPRTRVSFETPGAKAKVTEMPVCTPGFVSWRAQRNFWRMATSRQVPGIQKGASKEDSPRPA